MRKTVLIIAFLLFGAAVPVSNYFLYSFHVEKLSYDDVIYSDLSVKDGKKFKGKFYCPDETKQLCGYTYKIKDGTLYLTLKGTSGGRNILKTDALGYATIEFKTDETIKEVVYHVKGKESVMSFEEIKTNGADKK